MYAVNRRVTSTTWGSLPPCKQATSFPGFYTTRVGENPGNEVGKQALNQEYSQDETKKTHKGASSTCSTLSLTLQGKPNNFQ